MKTRILVPPGIGDGYWVIAKLRGFLRRHNVSRPEIWIQDGSPRRSHEMWQRVPFVDFGGYAQIPRLPDRRRSDRKDKEAVRRAYRRAGGAVQRQACGFDWFLSLNGTLDAGQSLDQGLPGPTNWYETMHDEVATATHAADYREQFGEYVACAFWEHGNYGKWLAEFPEPEIVRALQAIADTGRTVVIMGAAWDRGAIADRLATADPRFRGLVGETNFDQLCGLLSGSAAVVGFPAGNTLIGPYFRRPTVLLWNGHFPRPMWTNSVPPRDDYRALHTATATADTFAAAVLERLQEETRAAA
jgi:hypothetical protein